MYVVRTGLEEPLSGLDDQVASDCEELCLAKKVALPVCDIGELLKGNTLGSVARAVLSGSSLWQAV